MKRNFTCSFLLSLLLCSAPAKSGNEIPRSPASPVRQYPASLTEGMIGITKENSFDNPADNIFHVRLPEQICADENVWLVYDLEGVEDHLSVSRSINDQPAVGGYFVNRREEWSTQREQVSAAWLKAGDNVIRFTTPPGASHYFRIKNLRLEIHNAPEQEIALSHFYFQDKVYIKGFVQPEIADRTTIRIAGKNVRLWNGEFETIVDVTPSTCELQAEVIPDGAAATCHTIFLSEQKVPDITYPFSGYVTRVDHYVDVSSPTELRLDDASMVAPPGALKNPATLTIIGLRPVDLPALDAGMVNVTKRQGGYRFLPHGTIFLNPVEIHLPFEASLIPVGYTEKDIRTFYFDERSHHWIPLAVDTVHSPAAEVVSRTTHFTDFINAIIQAPESPVAEAYNSNTMKGIQAANPAEAINLINAPVANSRGGVSLSHTLNLPPGRGGVQPLVMVHYGNEDANGWLGLGWSLEVPTITIDTRWGVPRYNPLKETETYLINGQQLSPVAHRGEWVDRTPEKAFHLRVEGSFDKIVRHGDQPSNYWWEVTDKLGTRYFYGASPSGLDASAVLRDQEAANTGNVARWCLREVRDLNGNTIRYHYTKVQDTGLNGGTVEGHQIYLASISYTGHNGSEGAYTVVFTRDRDMPGWTKRTDVTIAGNLGFKEVTADLLKKIEVKFNGQNVRHYELTYTTGEFYKTLLTSIREFDAGGIFFNAHTFEYYNDVRKNNTFAPLEISGTAWNVPGDNIREDFAISDLAFSDRASALSGNRSTDINAGLSVTVAGGFQNLACKTFSVGGNYSRGEGRSEGLLSMVDINGDGLSDKVILKGGDVQYRANLGLGAFSETLNQVSGIADLYREKSKTNNIGFEANLGQCKTIGLVINKGLSLTTSTTTAYFTDVNGDQLIDFVKDGNVYFNTVDTVSGNVSFTTNSGSTPSPIVPGASPTDAVTQTPEELLEAQEQHPLHDVVRVWRAPFDGLINVTAPVHLIEDTSPARADATPDGVRVAIQLRGAELWNALIEPEDYSVHTPSAVTGLFVNKGDRIYFRVGSRENGLFDQVEWAPVIQYTSLNALLSDANGNSLYRFDASRDHILASVQTASAPVNGVIEITGNFEKPQTTDNVHLVVLRRSGALVDTVMQQKFQWNETVNFDFSQTGIAVQEFDEFTFKVVSSTTIDWSQIHWQPRINYLSTDNPAINLSATPIEAFPVPQYSVLPEIFRASRGWKVNFFLDTLRRDTITFAPVLNVPIAFPALPEIVDDITFSIKKRDTLLAKRTLHVLNGRLTDTDTTLTVVVNREDSLYVEFHVPNLKIAERVNFSSIATGEYLVTQSVNTGVYSTVPPGPDLHDQIFGPLYRGWGHFAWRGNGTMATSPMDESLMRLSEDLTDPADPGDFDVPDDLDNPNVYDQATDQFIMLTALGKEQLWQGYDNLTFVTAIVVSSSRLGDDDLSAPSASGGAGAFGINKISKSRSDSFSAGLTGGSQTFNASGNYSWSDGNATVVTDYLDMNGDRFPDIVTKDVIQYTNAQGGLESGTVLHGQGTIQNSVSHSEGVSVAGSAILSQAEPSNFNIRNVKMSVGNGQNSAGLNGSYAWGGDNATISWLDVNGDGLPDRVATGISGKKVALNLGYRFADEELWNFTNIQEGESNSKSAGLGVAFGNGSVNVGVGISQSDNFATYALIDVNGDGLPDQASHPDRNGMVKVRINSGNQFMSEELDWTGADHINENSSTSESANLAFTIGIPIPPIFTAVTLYINPSAGIGHGLNRELSKFADMDADGHPDFVRSSSDDQLTVYRSTIGRTNMLKKVTRPLGAAFTMTYKQIGNTYAMPNSVWTLDSVKMFDGFENDGVDRMLQTFVYEDGYFDRHEREFYGFKKVVTRRHDTGAAGSPVYTIATRTFNNTNFYEKGLLLNDVLTDGMGNKFEESVVEYQLKDVATGAALPESAKTDDAGTAFPARTRMEKHFYEGQPSAGKTTEMTFAYDEKGNLTSYTDFGETTSDDDLTSVITYHNVPIHYLHAIPSSIVVTGSGVTYRKREQTIDTETGDILQIKQYLDASIFAQFDMEYDAFGNLTKLTRPKNHDDERLSFDYTYDHVVNTHVTHVTNSYGYHSEATHDLRFGKLISTTDINGNEVNYTLDDRGRIVSIQGPYEKAAGQEYTIRFEYHPEADVPWALTKHHDPSHPGNDMNTAVFVDGLNRIIQTKKDGALFDGDGHADEEVMIVSGRILFDGLGRPTHTYYPVVEPLGTTGLFNTEFDSENPTIETYDVMDRNTSRKLPDLTMHESVYGFEDDRFGVKQFSTKTTDANGIQTEQFTDVRGRVTSVRNYTSSGDVWTSARYNPVNEQIESTDDLGYTTTFAYDHLGRRTSRTHPDAGLSTFTYDLAGNLIQKQNANLLSEGMVIEHRYDFERLSEIIYPKHAENNVRYTYGASGATANRAGRIVLQEDGTGAQEFFYGPLGETIKNIRTIIIPQHAEQTFTTEWQYDTWNRLTSIVYPDGERVEFSYNTGGLLNSMRGEKKSSQYSYVRQLGYDKFEQRVFLAYGNGTKSTFSYEPDRRRLKNITARTTANRVFMDNVYGYDNTDNITTFHNQAPVPPANLMGGPSEYEFDYDDLYRITSAQGSFRGKNERHHYTLEMSYNSVGGVLNKAQLHERGGNNLHTEHKTTYNYAYAYATEQPHAPIHIGDRTFTYDANGNQTGWTDDTSGQRRHILWDEENSIRAIYDNGALYHYMYDASGERVLKGHGSGQWVYVNGALKGGNGQVGNYTVYVNPYIVLHSGGYTKHYYMENQRIVSKLGGGFDNNGQGPLKAGGNKVNYLAKHQQAIDGISRNLSLLGMSGQGVQSAKSGKASPGQMNGNGNTSEAFRFFYHHDHLGSTNYVTDASGEVYQHLEYFAFGETFVEEHSNTHRTPYLFSSKELDSETGLYYFGARYYDPRTSVWQSVDPLTEKYAALSPYQYAANNPLKYLDPDGRDLIIWYTENGKEKSYNFKGVADSNMPKNKFVEQVVEAYNYNVNNKGGDNLKKIATSTEVHVNVREQASPTPKEGELLQTDQKNIGNVYQEKTNTILWDPYGGLATDQAIVLSPATGLEHEGDHAWKHITDPKGYRKLVETKDKTYTDAEEKRVIMGSELKTARNNGELKKDQKVTRGTHGGFYVKTTGPTSTKGPKKKSNPGIIEELK